MAVQKTYIMIKPDGVKNKHIGEIVNRFERAGLSVERMELGMVTPEQAAANYAEHEGKPFYNGLIEYITSGPVVKMIISGARWAYSSRKANRTCQTGPFIHKRVLKEEEQVHAISCYRRDRASLTRSGFHGFV